MRGASRWPFPDKLALRQRRCARARGIAGRCPTRGGETDRRSRRSAWLRWATPRRTSSAPSSRIGDELDASASDRGLHLAGHRLCLPVMAGKEQPLTFPRLRAGRRRSPTVKWGIREPKVDQPGVCCLTSCSCPCSPSTATGHRLGYGGGYYDRTLQPSARRHETHHRAIGLAFDAQVIDAFPISIMTSASTSS